MSKIKLYGYLGLKKVNDNLNFVKPIFSIKSKYYWLRFEECNSFPNVKMISTLKELKINYLKNGVEPISEDIEVEAYGNIIPDRYYFLKINGKNIYGYREEILEQLFSKFTSYELKKLDPENLLIYFMIFNYDDKYLVSEYLSVFSKNEFINFIIQLFINAELSEDSIMAFSNLIESSLDESNKHQLLSNFNKKDINHLKSILLEKYPISLVIINAIAKWNNIKMEITEVTNKLVVETIVDDLIKLQKEEEEYV